MAGSKVCFKCNVEKDFSEFYRHAKMADGYLGKCKACTKADVAAHRVVNIDRVRAYDRNRAKISERAKAAARASSKWRADDGRKVRCHNAVARAIRSGKLQHRPCEWPGCTRDDSFAHHENYDKPLDVVFYCQPHHKARHKEMTKLGLDPLNRGERDVTK